WKLPDSAKLGIFGEYYESEKGIPGITTFPSPNASQNSSRYFINATWSDEVASLGKLDASFAWLRQSRKFSDPLGESTGVPLNTERTHTRWDAKIERTGLGFGDNDILGTGANFAIEKLDAEEYCNPERTNIAAWVRDEFYLKNGAVIEGALRWDSIDRDSVISPKIGCKYFLNDQWTVKSNFSLDFRAPGFDELYLNEGMVVGNIDLVPERSLNFDIGLTHASKNLRIECAYFNIQTKNLIDYLLISGFRWKPFNIGRTRSTGVELSGDWIIDKHFELKGNFTRTHAIDTSGDPTRNGKELVGQPSGEIFTELKWHEKPWELNLNWEWQGRSPITPSGTRFVRSHDTTGVGIAYELGENHSLSFDIANIFNESFYDVRGFPLPGRSFGLTYFKEW
ncbi:MAG: TonB-dependent receptor, partial [bacterium]